MRTIVIDNQDTAIFDVEMTDSDLLCVPPDFQAIDAEWLAAYGDGMSETDALADLGITDGRTDEYSASR